MAQSLDQLAASLQAVLAGVNDYIEERTAGGDRCLTLTNGVNQAAWLGRALAAEEGRAAEFDRKRAAKAPADPFDTAMVARLVASGQLPEGATVADLEALRERNRKRGGTTVVTAPD